MRGQGIVKKACLGALFAIAGGAGAWAFSVRDVAAVHTQLLEDPSYQFEFSHTPAAEPGWFLRALAAIARAIVDAIAYVLSFLGPVIDFFKPMFEWIGGFLAGVAPAGGIVFWAGIALIVAAALYYLLNYVTRHRRADHGARDNAKQSLYQLEPELARAFLEEADRLAAEGRFGEAVHALLFNSIEDIQRFQPNHIRQAMTSREIAHLAILPPSARSAFSQIAAAVERSHFAGRQIGASVFADCRAAYSAFAAPEAWS